MKKKKINKNNRLQDNFHSYPDDLFSVHKLKSILSIICVAIFISTIIYMYGFRTSDKYDSIFTVPFLGDLLFALILLFVQTTTTRIRLTSGYIEYIEYDSILFFNQIRNRYKYRINDLKIICVINNKINYKYNELYLSIDNRNEDGYIISLKELAIKSLEDLQRFFEIYQLCGGKNSNFIILDKTGEPIDCFDYLNNNKHDKTQHNNIDTVLNIDSEFSNDVPYSFPRDINDLKLMQKIGLLFQLRNIVEQISADKECLRIKKWKIRWSEKPYLIDEKTIKWEDIGSVEIYREAISIVSIFIVPSRSGASRFRTICLHPSMYFDMHIKEGDLLFNAIHIYDPNITLIKK